MHFWIDKTYLNPKDFSSIRNSRNKSLNGLLKHSHRVHRNVKNRASTSAQNQASSPSSMRHYQWLAVYVKSALCITIILIIFVIKLYSDNLLTRFQLVLFCTISVLFIFCTVISSALNYSPKSQEVRAHVTLDSRKSIDSSGKINMDQAEYSIAIKLSRADEPPSYDTII